MEASLTQSSRRSFGRTTVLGVLVLQDEAPGRKSGMSSHPRCSHMGMRERARTSPVWERTDGLTAGDDTGAERGGMQ